MSVDLSKLVVRRKITVDELNDRVIAVDAYNVLYQFLSIIRQPDGTPLMDQNGNVTSHLSGLFYRTIELIEHGVKPIYVFDGLPSMLKQKTIEARMQRRASAYEAWQQAKEAGAVERARTYAQQSSRVDRRIVDSSKQLLELMGVPYINAPGEGEAQASYMCAHGLVYAAASQDYDTLLFGSKNVVRNLALSGRRKLPKKNIYIEVQPELVNLDETLTSLGITRQQLIWIGILLGTDFNEGIKGVGPKTALKAAKSARSLADIKDFAKSKGGEFELDVAEVEQLFTKPEVTELERSYIAAALDSKADAEGIVRFMCDEHGFSKERVAKYAQLLEKRKGSARQAGISSWVS